MSAATEHPLLRPARPCGTGVLVLAGSSGRVDRSRAEVLRQHGAHALPLRWFGGPGQQPGPHEVPLETFQDGLDRLSAECDRLAIVGTSFGAEAALLVAGLDPRVFAVAAFAPSSVVWGGWDEAGRAWRSHWTRGGVPMPWVPFAPGWAPEQDPPAYRGLYETSLAAYADSGEAAIPVELVAGQVVLVAGGDDQVWPSVDFARQIASRRASHGLETTVVIDPVAGHRAVLPGEDEPTEGARMARGGTPEGNAALGAAAWPHLVAALQLAPP